MTTSLGSQTHTRFLLRDLAVVITALSLFASLCAGQGTTRQLFAQHYAAWRAHCSAVAMSSNMRDRLNSPDYRALVQMGPRILPYLAEKATTDRDFPWLGLVWQGVCRITAEPGYYPHAQQTFLQWWQAGPGPARKRFAELSAQWPRLNSSQELVLYTDEYVLDPTGGRPKTVREETKLGKTYRGLRDLGIEVLPLVMDQLKKGDYRLLWLVGAVTDGAGRQRDPRGAAASAKLTLQWWHAHQQEWTIPWPKKR